jgi:hypothetical protein
MMIRINLLFLVCRVSERFSWVYEIPCIDMISGIHTFILSRAILAQVCQKFNFFNYALGLGHYCILLLLFVGTAQ